ncbi:hypothetical protein SLA2020_128680 [Shorea laevis]
MNPDSFKCSRCSKVFPTCYHLYAHLHVHRFRDNGGAPPPPPQFFNRLPYVDRDDKVNQQSLTLSIGRSKVIDHDTLGLTMEEILWRQYKTCRYHPYLKPTNKGKEPLYVETVDDNFLTLDLLREWAPMRGLEVHGYDSWSSSSSPISNASTSCEIDLMSLDGGEKLDLDLKLGF